MYDVMIVGAGPAGLTAAVYSARKKLSTLLIAKDVGGQVNWTSGVENYMGYQFIQGAELMQKFEEQVRQFPVDLQAGKEVKGIRREGKVFEITTDKQNKYQGKTIIIASGKRPRVLNVPGEAEFMGKGVTYCAICDGPLFAGMDVAIIGGGNSALEAAEDMIRISDQVYLVSLTPLTGDQILVDRVEAAKNIAIFIEHEVLAIAGEKFVNSVRIRDLKTGEVKDLKVNGVFVEVGLIPNSEFIKDLAVLNGLGEIDINCTAETSIPGLFAAGDVTNVPEKQIVVAAGEGAKAALTAHKYLLRYQD